MNGIITLCSHPEGIKATCRCGANASCPICGFGRGCTPCNCDKIGATIDAAVKKYKKCFAEAWKALA